MVSKQIQVQEGVYRLGKVREKNQENLKKSRKIIQ